MTQQTAARFQTTQWTRIIRARHSPDDLARMLADYWPPIYGYLRRQGNDPQNAADLTQAFVAKIILDGDLLTRADPDRGRFRSFLKSCLNNFAIDEIRKAKGRNGARAAVVAMDPEQLRAAEPSANDDPATAFDRQWVATQLTLALARVEEECREEGMEVHWRAFESKVLGPVLHGTTPPPLDDLAAQIGACDGPEVSSMIHSVKRRFRRALREIVADTTSSPDDFDAEFSELQPFLAM